MTVPSVTIVVGFKLSPIINALAYHRLTMTLASFIRITVGFKFFPVTNTLSYFG